MKIGKSIGYVVLALLLLLVCALTLIKVRGFRASSSPWFLEVPIARGLRNFAIPPKEARSKNPHPNDELAQEQGRDLVKREMRPGERVHITPKTVHRMTAIEDSDIFEVSTPELDDVVRLEDRYGRG